MHPLGEAQAGSKDAPRERNKWVRKAPKSHTGKLNKLCFCVFGWAMKTTSALGLHFASPLRLLGSKGLGGMREAKTILKVWKFESLKV